MTASCAVIGYADWGTTVVKPKIYIEGQEGSTGLRIRQLLDARDDIELLLIPAAQRKDRQARSDFLNAADVAILCLPDEAAAEAVQELLTDGDTRVIDTSSARRTDADWTYGLPELFPEQRQAIGQSKRVANPGCYPVGFILAVRPLIEAGLLDPATQLTINAVSGYSGGGRKMIEAYGNAPSSERPGDAGMPLTLYGLTTRHKHLPEMQLFSLTEKPPLFVPSVDHTYCGMLTSTPIPAQRFAREGVTPQQVWEVWHERYADEPFVRTVAPGDGEEEKLLRGGNFLDLDGANFTNRLDLFAFGDESCGIVLIGRQDNLGKGASGNAVQCLNLMLGLDEGTGLSS